MHSQVLQHQTIVALFEDRLHLSPLTHPRRVLDVGTGPGLWAMVSMPCAAFLYAS